MDSDGIANEYAHQDRFTYAFTISDHDVDTKSHPRMF